LGERVFEFFPFFVQATIILVLNKENVKGRFPKHNKLCHTISSRLRNQNHSHKIKNKEFQKQNYNTNKNQLKMTLSRNLSILPIVVAMTTLLVLPLPTLGQWDCEFKKLIPDACEATNKEYDAATTCIQTNCAQSFLGLMPEVQQFLGDAQTSAKNCYDVETFMESLITTCRPCSEELVLLVACIADNDTNMNEDASSAIEHFTTGLSDPVFGIGTSASVVLGFLNNGGSCWPPRGIGELIPDQCSIRGGKYYDVSECIRLNCKDRQLIPQMQHFLEDSQTFEKECGDVNDFMLPIISSCKSCTEPVIELIDCVATYDTTMNGASRGELQKFFKIIRQRDNKIGMHNPNKIIDFILDDGSCQKLRRNYILDSMMNGGWF